MNRSLRFVLAVALSSFSVLALGCAGSEPPPDGSVAPDAQACDVDGDCEDGLFCNGVERCASGACVAGAGPCATGQRCAETADECVTDCAVADDADGDGAPAIACGGNDCDDSDALRHPGNVEVCDAEGHDEDCIPTTLGGNEGDLDGDGFLDDRCCYRTPGGVLQCGTDCDDGLFGSHPGAIEVCNGIDDDCNGFLDHPDEDDDGDGHADDRCAGALGSDCDDSDPNAFVGADELCNGLDDDCSIGGMRRRAGEPGGEPAEDVDGDDHAPTDAMCLAMAPDGTPAFPRDDCDDGDAAAFAGAAERCNGIDDDCDGVIDDAPGSTVVGTACVPAAITIGGDVGCALRSDGTVVCWGANGSGQLGDAAAPGDAAIVVPMIDDAVQIDAGGAFACARRMDGSVWCWGNAELLDAYGPLRPAPASGFGQVPGLTDVTDFSAGTNHACAVSGGRVLCWGMSCMGLLDGTSGDCGTSARPLAVPGIDDAVQVDAGGRVSCAVRSGGGVACWGMSAAGTSPFGGGPTPAIPSVVTGITNAVEVAAGADHACARLATGAVQCWGEHTRGALGCVGVAGCPAFGAARDTPVAVRDLLDAVSLESGAGNHTCAERATGELVCWGANDFGQLGDDDLIDPSGDAARDKGRPTPVVMARDETAPLHDVAVGAATTCALSPTRAYCWGRGDARQIGDGRTDHTIASYPGAFNSSRPVPVSDLASAIQIVGANDHTCFRMPDGDTRCAGADDWNEIGPAWYPGLPIRSTVHRAGDRVVHIATSPSLTCAAYASGDVACSGSSGGVGAVAADAVQVGAGDIARLTVGHACFLRRDGTAACAGNNLYGQLGSATPGDSGTPVAVAGLTGGLELVTGSHHNCVRTATQVLCWGRGTTGQIGSPPSDSGTARPVADLDAPAIDLSALGHATCAVLSDGTVWCWGESHGGASPTRVGTISDAVRVAVTAGGGCALSTDGRVRCWGANESGQLGNGTTTPTSAVVQPTYLRDAVAIGCGAAHCCATRTSGQVVCWGNGTSGQLANVSTSSSSRPVTTADLLRTP